VHAADPDHLGLARQVRLRRAQVENPLDVGTVFRAFAHHHVFVVVYVFYLDFGLLVFSRSRMVAACVQAFSFAAGNVYSFLLRAVGLVLVFVAQILLQVIYSFCPVLYFRPSWRVRSVGSVPTRSMGYFVFLAQF